MTAAGAPPGGAGMLVALRLPAYRWYLAALVASMLANELQTVAVGWQLYEATHDPLSLGLIGLAGVVPFVSTVLVAGHVADICDRRRVALVAMSALALCTLALTALSASGVAMAHHWTIYAAVVAAGFARSFLMPARGALAAELVPRPLLEQATRLRSSLFQLAAVAGRSASGFIYAGGVALGWGAAFTYGVAVLLLLAALAGLAAIRRAPPPRATPEPVLRSLTGGVRYVLRSRILFGAMVLDLLGVLFGDAIILLPIFADQVWRIGPEGLGVLRAAPAAGAVAMALLLARRPPFRHAGRTLLLAVGCFGVAQIGFALAPWFPLAALALAVSGACDFVSVLVRGALLQVLTPPALLGRVTAVQQVFIWSSNELGAFESGVAARLLGLVPSVVVGGAVTLAVTGVVAWRNRALRGLGRIAAASEAQVVEAADEVPAAVVPAGAR